MNRLFVLTGLNWLWIVLIVLIVDFSNKYLILQNFALGETMSLFPSLNLHYARNYGIAFSFFSNSSEGWLYWVLVCIAVGVCITLLLLMYRMEATQKLVNIAYALIIGGTLGNLFDRLWYGFVIDMIDFYIGNWHFATFNLADSAICIGTALVILKSFLSKTKPSILEQK